MTPDMAPYMPIPMVNPHMGCNDLNLMNPCMYPYTAPGTTPQVMADIDREDNDPINFISGTRIIDKENTMYSCPFVSEEDDSISQYREDRFSYIRLLHASPDAPAVDVYVNNRPVVKHLMYRHFTPYYKFSPGTYDIKAYPAGKTTSPVINTRFNLPARSIYTLAAVGRLRDISLQAILEPVLSFTPGTSMVRFIHLSPNTPHVDITLSNGRKLFKDVEYREVTGYIPVNHGTYTIQARVAGTNNIALVIPNIRLLPNRVYSMYAVGLLGERPPLQVLIPMDGSTYLKFRNE